MLPKEHRLISRDDFKGAITGTARARSGPFALVCRKNNRSFGRFGFTVSLAVSKKAVLRNTLRRRLHEVVGLQPSILAIGYDCVVWTYPDAVKLKFKEIERFIKQMFEKAGVL